jgi:hypothetical protein
MFLFFLLIVLWHPMGGAKGNGFCMRDGFGDQDCLGAFAFFLFVCVVAELHEGIVHTIRSVVRLRADSRERERARDAKAEWTCLIALILTHGFASFFKSELVLMCCRRKGTGLTSRSNHQWMLISIEHYRVCLSG